MAYIVDANEPSRPLDTDPRKQGAEELRALKLRVNNLKTTLENADSANAGAAAAALAAANTAQGAANNAQGSANAASSAAAAAQGSANAALAAAALSAIKIKSIVRIDSGSGNVPVPADCTSCLVFGKGGDWDGYSETPTAQGSAAVFAPVDTAILAVTAGSTIAYSIGAINYTGVYGNMNPPTPTTLGSFTARAAPRVPSYNGGASLGAIATVGWLLLIFY